MFMIIISANLRHDKGTISDMSLLELTDVSTAACAVISTVASRPVRQCTVTQTRCCPWHKFPRGDLQFHASLRTDQDKACDVYVRNDPLSVCDTVL
jgi:hypothetical protein